MVITTSSKGLECERKNKYTQTFIQNLKLCFREFLSVYRQAAYLKRVLFWVEGELWKLKMEFCDLWSAKLVALEVISADKIFWFCYSLTNPCGWKEGVWEGTRRLLRNSEQVFCLSCPRISIPGNFFKCWPYTYSNR